MKKLLIIIGISIVFLGLFYLAFAQEQITVTTYYPSPSGSYRELTWGNLPNSRGRLSADQGSSIEVGGSGTPYIDLSNKMAIDFDFRLILTDDDNLHIQGGRTTFMEDDGSPSTIRVREVLYCSGY